jgi:uncharacterized protein (DUF736 family)
LTFRGFSQKHPGWKKTSKAGKLYISIKLDDPSFAQPVHCALKRVDETYYLDWNRASPRRPGNAAAAGEEI